MAAYARLCEPDGPVSFAVYISLELFKNSGFVPSYIVPIKS